jgi:hypothetical protein
MPAPPSGKSGWKKESLESRRDGVKGSCFEGQTEEKRLKERIMKL